MRGTMLRNIRAFVVFLMAIAVVVLCQETPSPTRECQPSFIGDGYCDMATNNAEECDYDGGDCCECTCVAQEYPYDCLSFACLDPDAECFGDTPSPSVIPESTPSPSVTSKASNEDNSALVLSIPTGTVLGLAAFWLVALNRGAW